MICSSNEFFIKNPDPNLDPDPNLRLNQDPDPRKKIISDPQHWFSDFHVDP
jgi:hypothetical protein